MPRLKTKPPVNLYTNVNSPVSEAYRTLRININFLSLEHEPRAIAVASANPGEGKTTVALQLAYTYAQAGSKVILVDADLRNPSPHLAFAENSRAGLTEAITQRVDLNDVIISTHIENLSLIATGAIPPNPSELLASNRMDLALTELKQHYDIVLIDTPPALQYIDAKIISAKCDGVLLVVEYGKVKRKAIQRVKDELGQVKANLLGTVMNKINGNGSGVYS